MMNSYKFNTISENWNHKLNQHSDDLSAVPFISWIAAYITNTTKTTGNI